MMPTSHLRERAWAWYLIAGALGSAAYMMLPGLAGNPFFFNVLGYSSAVAIVVGVRWNRPKACAAWYLLALGQVFFVTGDVLAYNYERFFHAPIPFPSIADVLYLAVYPTVILGLLLLVRRRSPGGDRVSLLDALIITLGAGLVSWVFLMAPIARDAHSTLAPKLTAMSYPLMDLALLAVLVRLAVGAGVRTFSYRLLLLGATALLVSDAIYGWINVHETYTQGPLDLGWLAFYLLWGAAALHPSMRDIDRPVAVEPYRHVRRRLIILAAAALLGPLVTISQSVQDRGLELGVISVCTAAMFVLVLLRLNGAMVDITQYRKTERLATEAERKYRSLVEDLPAIVYVCDADPAGTFRYLSPQVQTILGYDSQAIIEDPQIWALALDEGDRDRVIEARTGANALGEHLLIEYRIRARDGRMVWIRHEGHTIPDEDGGFVRQGVMYDVTDIKRAEEALVGALTKEREAATHLRALDEMKTSFLQAISHDLRTPLTTILGSALTLERSDIDLPVEDTRDLAGRIAANARRLSRLLTNLLDLDRISRGIVEPNRRDANLDEMAHAAIEGVALDGRDLRLDIAPVRANVDAAQVERIVENLIVNAVRYTPAGTPIDVSMGPSDGGLLIRVDDRGPGVPEPIRSQIFEPFRQGSATEAHAPGVGIGLSLVARFAELHGGRAWVEPRIGGGASFRVWLDARTEPIDGQPPPAAPPAGDLWPAPPVPAAATRPRS
jgi:PAS domain S-box-containing protein